MRMKGFWLPIMTALFFSLVAWSPLAYPHDKPIRHRVKRGETLIRIMTKKYGFTLREYYKALPRFKKLNPQVKDINLILYGFYILIPERSSRPSAKEAPEAADIRLEQVSDVNLREVSANIFPKMGMEFKSDGETVLELAGYGQVRIDNHRFPLVQFPGGKRLLLDYDGSFPERLKALLRKEWPDYKVIGVDQRSGLKGLMERVFSDPQNFTLSRDQTVVFGDRVKLILRGDWKVEASRESVLKGKVILLNLVEEGHLPIPQHLIDYARDYGFEVIEVRSKRSTGGQEMSPKRGMEGMLVSIEPGDNATLSNQLLQIINQGFEENRPVKFQGAPLEGIEIEFVADRLLERGGEVFVIDFSNLPDDLISLARDFGAKVVRISKGDSFGDVVRKIYGALNIPHTFSSYRIFRDLEKTPSYYDVEVPAFFVSHRIFGLKKSREQPELTYLPTLSESFLLTDASIPPVVERILEDRGYTLKHYTR